ncbi:MAG: hypothetical protein FWD57_10610 [Polyangiaceae bacterium]|nr:hypothetical protein [Polyangiaceae bacterium]
MDSVSNAEGLWPGCYRHSSGCGDKNEMVRVFDRLFRHKEGNLGGNGLTDLEELVLIGWRVEGALWTIGGLAGVIPKDLFGRWIPAANFGVNSTLDAPVPTIYGYGRFLQVHGHDHYRLGWSGPPQDSSDDTVRLGNAYTMPTDASSVTWAHLNMIPSWIRYVYDNPGEYLRVWGVNHELVLKRPNDVSLFVLDVANGFSGMKCLSSASAPFHLEHEGVYDKNPVQPPWLSESSSSYNEIVNLRMGRSWGDLCQAPNAIYPPILSLSAFPAGLGGAGHVRGDVRDYLRQSNDMSGKPSLKVSALLPGYPDNASQVDKLLGNSPYGIPWWLSGTAVEFPVFPRPPCRKILPPGAGLVTPPPGVGLVTLSADCIDDAVDAEYSKSRHFRYTHRMLRPQHCSASKRVPAFVNSYPPSGHCGAAAQLVQAVAMACELHGNGIFPIGAEPPTIDSLEKIGSLGGWVAAQEYYAKRVLSGLYLESVPERVIDDFRKTKVGSGPIDGEYGQAVVQMGTSIRLIYSNWMRAMNSIKQLGIAITRLHLELEAANIREEQALRQIAFSRAQVHRDMAAAAASPWSSLYQWATTNPLDPKLVYNRITAASAVFTSTATITQGYKQLAALDDMKHLAGKENANQMLLAFNNFERDANTLYTDLKNAMNDVQNAVAETMILSSKLRQIQSHAQYAAAKGSGEEYAVIGGKKVLFPVNSVLSNQYDITKRRYQEALREAKYLAYIARLAIEQRIGMRMEHMETKVGPLEAPATWADDVCRLQGIDYDKLRSIGGGTSTAAGKFGILLSPEFMAKAGKINPDLYNSYIGDYVAKLGNFVDYYNIQYPSHDGDDTAVLSLREDFVSGDRNCIVDAPNLLYYSDQLNMNGVVSVSDDEESEEFELRGWLTGGCYSSTDRCIDSSGTLPAPITSAPESEPENANDPPIGEGLGGVTWLRESGGSDPSGGGSDAGSDAGSDGGPDGGLDAGYDASPDLGYDVDTDAEYDPEKSPRAVWQAVRLEPGTHLLSWHDQARSAEGTITLSADPISTMRVGLYDENWMPVRVEFVKPHEWKPSMGNSGIWSDRRTLEVSITKPGWYYVAFGISFDYELPGSVAIANVQLERITSPGAAPTAYIQTQLTRRYVSSNCGIISSEEFRNEFDYHCNDKGACYYELRRPLIIDTTTLGTQASRFNGKIASDNFNLRHITFSLNLVGTGIRDCKDGAGASCYGSGFIEYSLDHNAFKTDIVDWSGKVQSFDFGQAYINHGKSLATERYITFPIGSADSSMLSQPGIQKTEFRGRPLDGSYRLRIWDDGAVRWDRLEDIQFVLQYRYWSAISRSGGVD